MVDRVVILRVGDHLFSLPFVHVDEILGVERAVRGSDVPEGAGNREPAESLWVDSRGRWLVIEKFLPDQARDSRSQIVVMTDGESARAIIVDQVVGIEKAGPLAGFPQFIQPYMDIPFAGVRFLKDRPVLELDLSRLFSLDIEGTGIG